MQKLPGITAPIHADKPAKAAVKTSLLTLNDLDGRTQAAKQAVAMRDAIVADLGGEQSLSAVKLELVSSLAVMTAIINDASTRWVRGDPDCPTLGEMATLTNSRNRTAQLVGLDRVVKDITNLDAYLAR